MNRRDAIKLLEESNTTNLGPWINHSKNVAILAEYITKNIPSFDPEEAYIFGLLHDIGRKYGFSHIKHTLDGYRILKDSYPKAAFICLSHSFPNKIIHEYQGNIDISEEEQKYIQTILANTEYDYYDELIQICDSYATSNGFVNMETRWVDVVIRNGFNKFTIDKWKKIYDIKHEIEEKYSIRIDKYISELNSKKDE